MYYCPFIPYMKCPCSICGENADQKINYSRLNYEGAYIRFVHASPDAPPVDIYIDDRKAVSNLAYSTFAGYFTVPSGSHKVEVYPSGSTMNPVISANINLQKGSYNTVHAAGRLANIMPIVLLDFSAQIPPTKTLVRFSHLSPDSPPVDITLNDGTVIFSNTAFARTTNYITLNAGRYDLQVRLSSSGMILLNLPEVLLEGGKAYTIMALGLSAGQPPLKAAALDDGILRD